MKAKKDPVFRHALEIAEMINNKKGSKTMIFDLRGISPITDFFVITTGLSKLHTQAIAEYIRGHEKPYHVEGMETGHWILLDYIDIIIHIFTREIREFYGLERLWGDAPMHELGNDSNGN